MILKREKKSLSGFDVYQVSSCINMLVKEKTKNIREPCDDDDEDGDGDDDDDDDDVDRKFQRFEMFRQFI